MVCLPVLRTRIMPFWRSAYLCPSMGEEWADDTTVELWTDVESALQDL